MNELQTTRTPEVVAAEIRALTASMLSNVIEIGRRMVEAKEMLPHGKFGTWITENTGYSTSTANNFMRLYEKYGARQGSLFENVENTQTFGKLSYSKALALLSLPESEREDFVRENDVEAMSTRELQKAIRERDEFRREAEEAKAALADAEQTIDDYSRENVQYTDELAMAEKRIRELESRPVEVAVQAPDPKEIDNAVKTALAEAEKKHTAAMDKLQKKVTAAETARDKARAEAETAGKKAKEAEDGAAAKIEEAAKAAAKEAESYKREAEELRRKLAMSDETVTTFKLHFATWQRAHSDMMAALAKADAETAARLRAAVAAQLEGWKKEK